MGARTACGSKGDGMGGLDWAAGWGIPAACSGLSIDIMPPLVACELGPAPGTLSAHRTSPTACLKASQAGTLELLQGCIDRQQGLVDSTFQLTYRVLTSGLSLRLALS